ncbi:MAG: succinate dehydrogenase, cytochrome b556 subunit [Gammaproteobacteria bacterium]
MLKRQAQPRFLDLRKIKLPLPGVVSILHRISGVMMVAAIPFCIYLLEQSLQDQEGYARTVSLTDNMTFKLVAIILLWSLSHHLFSGIRFLLLDVDVGIERSQARNSSKAVFLASVLSTLIFTGVIW